jgi:hypothetical protein
MQKKGLNQKQNIDDGVESLLSRSLSPHSRAVDHETATTLTLTLIRSPSPTSSSAVEGLTLKFTSEFDRSQLTRQMLRPHFQRHRTTADSILNLGKIHFTIWLLCVQ